MSSKQSTIHERYVQAQLDVATARHDLNVLSASIKCGHLACLHQAGKLRTMQRATELGRRHPSVSLERVRLDGMQNRLIVEGDEHVMTVDRLGEALKRLEDVEAEMQEEQKRG